MKLGLGLYRHMLTTENFKFAKQAGCTDLIVHLADYYKEILPATDTKNNYGISAQNDPIWELDNLIALRKSAAEQGLNVYGIENFSPSDWYDVLLDGPKKQEQMDHLKKIITNVGKAGFKTFGYNFSIAGVWGHRKEAVARGGAISACFDASKLAIDEPIPNGQVWNMTYNPDAQPGVIGEVTDEELWDRLTYFLKEIIPVAEEAGVVMAAHPDDPPMPRLRGTSRLVYQPEIYQRLLDIVPSPYSGLEFCMGSIQEMENGNIYDAIKQYGGQDKISYIHFRNVKGKVPNYQEVFVDEGDIDMIECLRLLKACNFEGVLIPDHTPQMLCDAPWHAGMAYALGYMKAAMQIVEREY